MLDEINRINVIEIMCFIFLVVCSFISYPPLRASYASKATLDAASRKANIAIAMKKKKDTTIGVRVDDDLLRTIQSLADEEDRTLAAMTRRLVVESLKKRGRLKSPERRKV